MSRLRVSAAGLLGTAFVVLATSCTNDFDRLFEGSSSSGGTDGGKTDTRGDDTGSAGCSCGPTVSDGDGQNTKFLCPTCACKCGDIRCNPASTGGCDGTCEESTFCDVTCSPTSKCNLNCRSGASCVLHCAKGFDCSLECSGGKRVDCGNGVYACNSECP